MPGENICTDIKVTSITQPQSSCPFKNARQKIYGLGYNLLVFVYNKEDSRNDLYDADRNEPLMSSTFYPLYFYRCCKNS